MPLKCVVKCPKGDIRLCGMRSCVPETTHVFGSEAHGLRTVTSSFFGATFECLHEDGTGLWCIWNLPQGRHTP
jgi:hypothetical protein